MRSWAFFHDFISVCRSWGIEELSILFNAIERIRNNEKEQHPDSVPLSAQEGVGGGLPAAGTADTHPSPPESAVPVSALADLSSPAPDEQSPSAVTLLVLEDEAATLTTSGADNPPSASESSSPAAMSADIFSSAASFIESGEIVSPPLVPKPDEVKETEEERGEKEAGEVKEVTREAPVNFLKARVSWFAFPGAALVVALIFFWIFPGTPRRYIAKSFGPVASLSKSSGGKAHLSGKASTGAKEPVGEKDSGAGSYPASLSMVELNNLGVKSVREKDPWRALYYFERAAKLDSKAAAPLINMSITLSELGLSAPATRIFQEAQTLAPEHPVLRNNSNANQVAGKRGR